MTQYAIAYRLRIRDASTTANPDGTTDVLTVTSVRGGTNPYITEPPNGDGQSVDPLTGETVTAAYTVLVADVVTGTDGTGTQRLVTTALEDATLRQQLLSRRAYLDISEDGGATFPTGLVAGYVNALKLLDGITWAFTIGDARRIEQNHHVFTWSNVPGPLGISERDVFPKRGCLIGGPIIGGLGPVVDTGGWEYEVAASETDPGLSGRVFLRLNFIARYSAPDFARRRTAQPTLDFTITKFVHPFREEYTGVSGFADTDFDPLEDKPTWYPALRVLLSSGASAWSGTLYHIDNRMLFLQLDAASSVSPPAVGTKLRVRVVQSEVSDLSPLYVSAHPVDIYTDLCDTVGIAWDATTAAAVKAALGATLRYTIRMTSSPLMAEFVRSALFGPFGFAARNGADGEKELFLTREVGTAAPAVTITTDHLPSEDLPPVFHLDESSIVTAFRVSYLTLARATGTTDSNTPPPPDGIVVGKVSVIVENADVSVFSTREVAYELPGMVHDAASFSPAMGPLIASITQEGFDRYGRGAIRGELVALRGTAGAAKTIGDEVNVGVAHYPSQGYRLGESSIAARIMQIVRRTELPEGALLELLDAGANQQPVVPAPTISIAAAPSNGRTLATFTVTNAAAINATGVLTTVIQWATGSSAPAGAGGAYIRYAPGAVPTGAVPLPPVAPGTTVHVRARTEQPYRRASSWTAWSSVALSALGAPTLLTVNTVTAASVEITWTPAAGGYPVDVYVYEGATAPGSGTAADWAPYRVTTLLGGSSQTIVRGLDAATTYVIGIAHRDRGTGQVGTVVSDDFTTTSNTGTAEALQAIAQIPAAEDASYRTGVALALYTANTQSDVVIERAPDSAGAPGTWADLVTLVGGTQVYVDELPSDGATWWYRARHESPGLDPSDWSTAISAIAGGVPDVVLLPAPQKASVNVEVATTATTVTMTFSGYELEMQIDTGPWSTPPSSPLVVTRGAISGGVDRVYSLRSIGLLGDVQTVVVLVPVQVYKPAPAPSDPTLTNLAYSNGFTPGDGGGSVDITWSTTNVPVGATYDCEWEVTAGDPISSGSGTEVGVTSGFTLNAPMGNNAELRTRVVMRNSGGTVVAEDSLESLVPV